MDADYRSSLVRRLRAVHHLYDEACRTMTLEQVNAVTYPGTLPIAFSLVHQVLIEDGSLIFLGGPAPLFNDDWAARIGLGVKDHGKERSVEEMMEQRIGDYDAFRDFQQRVFQASETYVASLDPSTMNDVVVAFPYGETLSRTFSALVAGETGITRSDALECWVYQHALRHMGEIELARSLVGLSGMTF
ncbi:MAG TPA: hypothetical protein VGG17_03590 [Acidimicrobiales bacterium]